MPLVQTVPQEAATGAVAEIYDLTRAALGHVPNFAQAFSLRPSVYVERSRRAAAIVASS